MARKIILKEDGLNGSGNAPTGYRYLGYDGTTTSEKAGATVSAIGGPGSTPDWGATKQLWIGVNIINPFASSVEYNTFVDGGNNPITPVVSNLATGQAKITLTGANLSNFNTKVICGANAASVFVGSVILSTSEIQINAYDLSTGSALASNGYVYVQVTSNY